MSAFQNISVKILLLLKVYTCFESYIFFYSVCHLSVKSFFPFQKLYHVLRKKHVYQGGLLHKEPRGSVPVSSFQLSGPGGKVSGGSYKG